MVRSSKDLYSGFIYVFFGVSAVIIGRDYSMGTGLKMGPAYFPTVLGYLLAAIGCISVIRAFMTQGTPIGRLPWKALLLIVGATIVFGLLV
ncbi:MAG: tripartite tricarboxylate transporter TctB family protein, partial [Candidatus Binatia bacterium]